MNWIGFVIFGVTLITKLNLDYRQYLKGKPIRHALEAAIVFVLLIVASYFSGWAAAPMFFFGFWILFDGCFNVLIGQPWGRIGETAALDKAMRKYPVLVWFKYIGFIASIIFFIWFGKG